VEAHEVPGDRRDVVPWRIAEAMLVVPWSIAEAMLRVAGPAQSMTEDEAGAPLRRGDLSDLRHPRKLTPGASRSALEAVLPLEDPAAHGRGRGKRLDEEARDRKGSGERDAGHIGAPS
jgi:hypothetical protein